VGVERSVAAVYNQAGYAQSRMGNCTAAEEAFKQFISLRPADPNPYGSYAELLLETGRYDESIAQYASSSQRRAGRRGSGTAGSTAGSAGP